MRTTQLLLLVVATFISTAAVAENSIQDSALATDSITETAAKRHRYLKGGETTTELDTADEERVAPSLSMLKDWLKLPKFQRTPKLTSAEKAAEAQKKADKMFRAWMNLRNNP
ncbi:hypothetical protein KRP22_011712 [Phytophthora ramorum]|uniref:RxLR effector protein n=1 Tax=Phytophthora ramorum TaxID=164328 RepID=H3GK95_PHYRM|nr:RXLR-class effector Avh36 [Phytophthora ramorum]AGZ84857.1 RXLR-class effector Avh36 [Phytophthora ramorum]AGZ84858.1 RXLR-class effector Avh36 [Phytophthora ramorum]KAH7468845.1 hypothetical protein KRP23_11221 [Phytophthora ramorum]KAH7498402.1 hypothetical protein KRP22_11546 [Phytophthora ramorum]